MNTNLIARTRFRKSFGHIKEILDMPNLIEVQRESYEKFLQSNTDAKKRIHFGLQQVLKEIFPIHDYSGKATLEFIKYKLDKPKYDVDECKQRGFTYASGLKVTLRLIRYDIDEEDIEKKMFRDSVDDEVYLGDMPLMTERGTFVVNGVERVVVSQMHRSPGVFFDHDNGKSHLSGKVLYSARIIPMRGSWIDFEFDVKDFLYVRIDRKKKMLASTFFMACKKDTKEKKDVSGMSPEEILGYFYETTKLVRRNDGWITTFDKAKFNNIKLTNNLINVKNKSVIKKAGSKITLKEAEELEKNGLKEIFFFDKNLIGKYFAKDIINTKTGKIFFEAGDEIDEKNFKLIEENNIENIEILNIDHVNVSAALRNTVHADLNINREEALIDIYRNLRPGEPPTFEAAELMFHNMFFNPERYDLSKIGRY